MSNAMFIVGFLAFSAGLWFIWPALATVIVGSLLMFAGLAMFINEREKQGDGPAA